MGSAPIDQAQRSVVVVTTSGQGKEDDMTPKEMHRKIADRYYCQYHDGLINRKELLTKLENFGIHGALGDDGRYIGYDYTNQQWIEMNK